MNIEQTVIKSYEEAFEKIHAITEESDLDVIVENFIKNEADNFAVFNYVNELNSEVELLAEQVCKHNMCSNSGSFL